MGAIAFGRGPGHHCANAKSYPSTFIPRLLSMTGQPVERSALVRWLWKAAGIIFLVIGLIGIIVPLLPTTPFVLLAAFCFQKGSDRLHQWLISHPRFGPLIGDWRERGAIPRYAKRNAMIALAAVLLISWLVGVGTHILLIQGVVLAAVATFILTRPD
jgi:uncharacterized protein